jgi:hypothetical protein
MCLRILSGKCLCRSFPQQDDEILLLLLSYRKLTYAVEAWSHGSCFTPEVGELSVHPGPELDIQ